MSYDFLFQYDNGHVSEKSASEVLAAFLILSGPLNLSRDLIGQSSFIDVLFFDFMSTGPDSFSYYVDIDTNETFTLTSMTTGGTAASRSASGDASAFVGRAGWLRADPSQAQSHQHLTARLCKMSKPAIGGFFHKPS
nr:hypothetical protein [uncultured Celeribacter sp.]